MPTEMVPTQYIVIDSTFPERRFIADSKKDIVKNGNLSENDCINILYKNTNMNISYGLNIAINYTTIKILCNSKEICDEFVTDANKFYKNKKKKK